jgi:hypothetical protein
MISADLLQDQNPWWRDGAIRRARGYPVRRDLQPEILSRILRLDDRCATMLLGPRQVGKTILLLQLADDLLAAGWHPGNLTYFDFSDGRITGEVTARDVVEARPVGFRPDHPRVWLLDAVGNATNWNWLEGAGDTGISRFVLADVATCQSRDDTRRAGEGWWDEVRMEGLSYREFVRFNAGLGEASNHAALCERYLSCGGFPEHARSEDLPEVRRFIRSDMSWAILRDLGQIGLDVKRVKYLFVRLIQESGAFLNATTQAEILGADPRSVREWARLLTNTFLLSPLGEFSHRTTAKVRPKFRIYAADPGLLAAFSLLPSSGDLREKLFAAAVFRHLREAMTELRGELTYFRLGQGEGVDFMADVGGSLTGIQVTSSSRLRTDKLGPLIRTSKQLQTDRLLLIHGGTINGKAEGVLNIAIQNFLADPVALLLGG